MEHKKDILNYISMYCSSYKTDLETAAENHYITIAKFGKYKDRSGQAGKLWDKVKHLISNDPKILDLLKDGYPAFSNRTAERIYNEHLHELDLNRCPKCNGIARTPQAKQCRYCMFSWR